jgi:hypothetical protein
MRSRCFEAAERGRFARDQSDLTSSGYPRRPPRCLPKADRCRLEDRRCSQSVSALGCYYFDPEGNRSEVFWVTGRACWVPIAHLIDIEQPDNAVLAEIDSLWERLRHVGIGERLANEPASLQLD